MPQDTLPKSGGAKFQALQREAPEFVPEECKDIKIFDGHTLDPHLIPKVFIISQQIKGDFQNQLDDLDISQIQSCKDDALLGHEFVEIHRSKTVIQIVQKRVDQKFEICLFGLIEAPHKEAAFLWVSNGWSRRIGW